LLARSGILLSSNATLILVHAWMTAAGSWGMSNQEHRNRVILGGVCIIGAALMFSLAGMSIKMASASLSPMRRSYSGVTRLVS
jgi:hypothetical protein